MGDALTLADDSAYGEDKGGYYAQSKITGKVVRTFGPDSLSSEWLVFDGMPGSGTEKAISWGKKKTSNAEEPITPEYADLLNPDGTLKSELQLKKQDSALPELDKRLSGIQLNKEGLEAIRKRALSSEMSDWEKMTLGKQGVEEQAAMDKSATESASNASAALSKLASTGGLSGGARERLLADSAKETSFNRQGVIRQGILDRFTIGAKAEDQKSDFLKALPGLEVNAIQPEFQKVDAWRQMSEAEKTRNLDVEKTNMDAALRRGEVQDLGKYKNYQEQMKRYGADRSKEAEIASSSGGGGLTVICTELNTTGVLDDVTYLADAQYGLTLPPNVIHTYHAWAIPVVVLMRKNKLVRKFVTPFALAWAHEMAHKFDSKNKSNLLGKFLFKFGLPVSVFVGSIILKLQTKGGEGGLPNYHIA